MSYDLVIRAALMVTPGRRIDGDLAVTGGCIAGIGPALDGGTEEVNGRGLILLPGGIDTHFHIAQRPVHGETALLRRFRKRHPRCRGRRHDNGVMRALEHP